MDRGSHEPRRDVEGTPRRRPIEGDEPGILRGDDGRPLPMGKRLRRDEWGDGSADLVGAKPATNFPCSRRGSSRTADGRTHTGESRPASELPRGNTRGRAAERP